MKKIVLIGGGNGISNIARGIPKGHEVTTILAMADSGGSTGRLRKEYGVPAIGDIRKVIARTGKNKPFCEMLQYRYESGSLAGHTLGNLMMIADLEKGKSLSECIQTLSHLADSDISILPCTHEDHELVMELSEAEHIVGEDLIDDIDYEERFVGCYLEPHVEANQQAIEAIHAADLIVIGPGSLHTSLFAALAPEGMGQALRDTQAKTVFVASITNQKGQTENYCVQDYVSEVSAMIGEDIFDHVIVNESRMDEVFCERCIVSDIAGGDNIKGGCEAGKDCGKIHDPDTLWNVLKSVLND